MGISGDIFRKKLERYRAVETGILSFVHHTHTAATKFFQDAVMRDGLTDERLGLWHLARMLGCTIRQVNGSGPAWPLHARTHGGLRCRRHLSPYWNWNGIRGPRPAQHTKVSHALVFPEKRMDVRPRNVGTGVVSKVVGLPGAITNRHKSMG